MRKHVYAAPVPCGKEVHEDYASSSEGLGAGAGAAPASSSHEGVCSGGSQDGVGTSYAGDNRPLRGGKGEVFEGGTRVPSVVRWPDKVPAGTKSEARLAVVDVLPTLIELSGVTQPLGKSLDGISAVDILTGKRTQTDRLQRDGERHNEMCLHDSPHHPI